MAKRFCGDVKIVVTFRWSTGLYRAHVYCTRGARNFRIPVNEVTAHLPPFEDMPDSPEAYDLAAKKALNLAMDATSADGEEQMYIAKEIADAAASALEAGGYKVLRSREFAVWLEQQTAPHPAAFAANS